MKAQELRIGNWVIIDCPDFENKYQIIPNVHEKGIMLNGNPYALLEIHSIPLTEEWLLKLRFTIEGGKRGVYYMHKIFKGFRIWKSDITTCFTVGRKQSDNTPTYWIADLKYVHQLQNLYYALTGEELIIDSYSPDERQQMTDKLDKALNEST